MVIHESSNDCLSNAAVTTVLAESTRHSNNKKKESNFASQSGRASTEGRSKLTAGKALLFGAGSVAIGFQLCASNGLGSPVNLSRDSVHDGLGVMGPKVQNRTDLLTMAMLSGGGDKNNIMLPALFGQGLSSRGRGTDKNGDQFLSMMEMSSLGGPAKSTPLMSMYPNMGKLPSYVENAIKRLIRAENRRSSKSKKSRKDIDRHGYHPRHRRGRKIRISPKSRDLLKAIRGNLNYMDMPVAQFMGGVNTFMPPSWLPYLIIDASGTNDKVTAGNVELIPVVLYVNGSNMPRAVRARKSAQMKEAGIRVENGEVKIDDVPESKKLTAKNAEIIAKSLTDAYFMLPMMMGGATKPTGDNKNYIQMLMLKLTQGTASDKLATLKYLQGSLGDQFDRLMADATKQLPEKMMEVFSKDIPEKDRLLMALLNDKGPSGNKSVRELVGETHLMDICKALNQVSKIAPVGGSTAPQTNNNVVFGPMKVESFGYITTPVIYITKDEESAKALFNKLYPQAATAPPPAKTEEKKTPDLKSVAPNTAVAPV